MVPRRWRRRTPLLAVDLEPVAGARRRGRPAARPARAASGLGELGLLATPLLGLAAPATPPRAPPSHEGVERVRAGEERQHRPLTHAEGLLQLQQPPVERLDREALLDRPHRLAAAAEHQVEAREVEVVL